MCQVQENMDLANIADSRYLDMAICQVQGNRSLANMSDPKAQGLGSPPSLLQLDLTVSQVQDNVGLTNMSNPRHKDLAVCQVYCTWTS